MEKPVVITSFEINNFKCFERLKVDDLAQITLLGGKNNVGKSSFLEAVFLYCDRFNPSALLRHPGWRGFITYPASQIRNLFASSFYHLDLTRVLHLKAQDGGVCKEVQMKVTLNPLSRISHVQLSSKESEHAQSVSSNEDAGHLDAKVQVDYYEDGQQVNNAEVMLQNRDLRIDTSRPSEQTPTVTLVSARTPSTPDLLAERYGKLDVRGKTDQVLGFLRIIEPRLESISPIAISKNSVLLHANVGLPEKIPVNFLGDGTNRLLSIVLAMANSRDGVVLIDEIDSGLHHSIMPTVWQGLKEAAAGFNCQVIATTHSYGCLQAAHEGLKQLTEPDFCYVRLDEEDEKIIPQRYSYQMLETAIEQGWEVR